MAKLVRQAHGGALKRHAKGETSNPNGRPRKYVSTLKVLGYKRSEIFECLETMLALTVTELQEIAIADSVTILEKTIAGALLKGDKNQSIYNLEMILSRAYGTPTSEVNAKLDVTDNRDASARITDVIGTIKAGR